MNVRRVDFPLSIEHSFLEKRRNGSQMKTGCYEEMISYSGCVNGSLPHSSAFLH
jgi:hypothetical protein